MGGTFADCKCILLSPIAWSRGSEHIYAEELSYFAVAAMFALQLKNPFFLNLTS